MPYKKITIHKDCHKIRQLQKTSGFGQSLSLSLFLPLTSRRPNHRSRLDLSYDYSIYFSKYAKHRNNSIYIVKITINNVKSRKIIQRITVHQSKIRWLRIHEIRSNTTVFSRNPPPPNPASSPQYISINALILRKIHKKFYSKSHSHNLKSLLRK